MTVIKGEEELASLGNLQSGRNENSRWAQFERWFIRFFGAYPSRTILIVVVLFSLLVALPAGIAGYKIARQTNAAAACNR